MTWILSTNGQHKKKKLKKTKSMLVTGRRIPSKVNDSGEDLSFQLKIGGVDINSVKSHKLSPGVTLDSEMSYECHVEELSKKLSKHLGLLKHISPYLKQAQREMYFNSIVKPILMYGIMIWDNCSNSGKQVILRSQKRAVRIILNAERETPLVSKLRLNWLPFYKESAIKRSTLVFKKINNKLHCPRIHAYYANPKQRLSQQSHAP